MSMGGGGGKEPRSAKFLRARQIADLADLDEEENRRIKSLLNARSTGRAFRPPGSMRRATNTRGGSLATPSGFNPPASAATRSAGSVGGAQRFAGRV